jgi:hypothetical protein
MAAEVASIGLSEEIITKIMRRKSDNRVIFELSEYELSKSKGYRAIAGTERYLLLQEKDQKLVKTQKPSDFKIVDAKKETLEKGETADGYMLDKVFGKKEQKALCIKIEKMFRNVLQDLTNVHQLKKVSLCTWPNNVLSMKDL